jgi:hypothetical protein
VTFWEKTDSNMFKLYQPSKSLDMARILLSIGTLLTYPLPFFSLRELLVMSISGSFNANMEALSHFLPTGGGDEAHFLLLPSPKKPPGCASR